VPIPELAADERGLTPVYPREENRGIISIEAIPQYGEDSRTRNVEGCVFRGIPDTDSI
jgi:hypothetical protein